MVDHFKQARQTIQNYRQHSLQFAVDDFGTGYSALHYLTQLPVDRIKIDKSFINYIGSNQEEAKLAELIINLSHELGYETVAEGVENGYQSDKLIEFGCDLGQGFYWGHPKRITFNGDRQSN